MSSLICENLQRLMVKRGFSAAELSKRSGVDRRTIRALLAGNTRPHWQTVHRLAGGLGVSTDELFLKPAQLVYRHLDRQANPAVAELISEEPELFVGWTEEDFDELFSRVGAGGPLTRQGALQAVEQMNQNRRAHEQLSLLLETSYAELVRRLLEALASLVVEAPDLPAEASVRTTNRDVLGRKAASRK
ncbi:MAG: helix-turn-helix domain-containing protein [Thermoguttaceae bacterium]|nr:helix-turn-helix domain-containing protein [Thermoguttaceae bacterium]MDW8038444.1 helix-turn-helix transcriptional regulator [Thermoguttaceae bacterium]